MGIVAALIVGLLAGALARLFYRNDDLRAVTVTLGLGVAGALVALGIGRELGWYGHSDGPAILGASLGAALVLTGYALVRKMVAP